MSLGALTRDLPARNQLTVSAASARSQGAGQQAIDALAKFIPTEMLAPFVAGLSLAATQGWDQGQIYVWFIIATPLVFVLFEFAKTAKDKGEWPIIRATVWRGAAATAAFAVWGLAVPENPYQAAIGGAAVAGFIALIVSPILTALDAIILKVMKVST